MPEKNPHLKIAEVIPPQPARKGFHEGSLQKLLLERRPQQSAAVRSNEALG